MASSSLLLLLLSPSPSSCRPGRSPEPTVWFPPSRSCCRRRTPAECRTLWFATRRHLWGEEDVIGSDELCRATVCLIWLFSVFWIKSPTFLSSRTVQTKLKLPSKRPKTENPPARPHLILGSAAPPRLAARLRSSGPTVWPSRRRSWTEPDLCRTAGTSPPTGACWDLKENIVTPSSTWTQTKVSPCSSEL